MAKFFKMVCKPFNNEPRGSYKVLVDYNAAGKPDVSVLNVVAGYYTNCHSLDKKDIAAIVRRAETRKAGTDNVQ